MTTSVEVSNSPVPDIERRIAFSILGQSEQIREQRLRTLPNMLQGHIETAQHTAKWSFALNALNLAMVSAGIVVTVGALVVSGAGLIVLPMLGLRFLIALGDLFCASVELAHCRRANADGKPYFALGGDSVGNLIYAALRGIGVREQTAKSAALGLSMTAAFGLVIATPAVNFLTLGNVVMADWQRHLSLGTSLASGVWIAGNELLWLNFRSQVYYQRGQMDALRAVREAEAKANVTPEMLASLLTSAGS